VYTARKPKKIPDLSQGIIYIFHINYNPDQTQMTATALHFPDIDQISLPEAFDSRSISQSILSLIAVDLAIEYATLPFAIDEHGRLEVLTENPYHIGTVQALQMHTGMIVRAYRSTRDTVLKLIDFFYGSQQIDHAVNSKNERQRRFSINLIETTVVIVNDIIHEAIRLRASDIHFEPFEKEMIVRFRIDGVLHEMGVIPKDRVPEIISRIKILSNMNIAEKRRAQDGKIRISGQGRDVDIRVSTLPTGFGEKAVLRLLDKSNYSITLDSIGMDSERLSVFKKALSMPNGIILFTGPTGSGKSTSLYAAINHLKRPDINISTVEDPIEYNITGVNQTQVNQYTGMTFANSLRTLLRQDPDVIMVGEMRDSETAEIAIRSSLTGHLVLSTLHTNDAPSAITRLIDMGIEPYLVSSSLTIIIAQRLVRKICTHCSCETTLASDIRAGYGIPPEIRCYKGLGCSACGFTGFRGRCGIFEVLPVTDTIRTLINDKAYAAQIREAACKEGMITLHEHAMQVLDSGVTSVEEILREAP
jgi:type IV pilus assembly protein PilB